MTTSLPHAYARITEHLMARLEAGVVPWHQPWQGGPSGRPCNGLTKRPYRGINVFMLGSAGYASPFWLTFKQVQALGGRIRLGEHLTPVVYWHWEEQTVVEEETRETRVVRRAFLKWYRVVNVTQCTGLQQSFVVEDASPVPPLEACEQVIAAMPSPPSIRHTTEDQAYYDPALDRITLPPRAWFHVPEMYYSTVFHELAHSTGHPERLARATLNERCIAWVTNYSHEELVAEMTAAFLCGVCGIAHITLEANAAYLASWLRVLRADARLLVYAAAQAQKAADFVQGLSVPPETALVAV